MHKQFEADLCPETMSPRLRLNFANGWALSIVLRMEAKDLCNYGMASVAAAPTGRWGRGPTEILENEATPDEVALFIKQIADRSAPVIQ